MLKQLNTHDVNHTREQTANTQNHKQTKHDNNKYKLQNIKHYIYNTHT